MTTLEEAQARFDEIKAAAESAAIFRRQGFDETDHEGLQRAVDLYILWSRDPRLNADLPGFEETVAEYGPLPPVLVNAFAEASDRGPADPIFDDPLTETWLRFFGWLADEFASFTEEAEASELVAEARRLLDDK